MCAETRQVLALHRDAGVMPVADVDDVQRHVRLLVRPRDQPCDRPLRRIGAEQPARLSWPTCSALGRLWKRPIGPTKSRCRQSVINRLGILFRLLVVGCRIKCIARERAPTKCQEPAQEL